MKIKNSSYILFYLPERDMKTRSCVKRSNASTTHHDNDTGGDDDGEHNSGLTANVVLPDHIRIIAISDPLPVVSCDVTAFIHKMQELGLVLNCTLSSPPAQIAPGWMNMYAPPSATLDACEVISNGIWSEGNGNFTPLTAADLNSIVYASTTFSFASYSGEVVTFETLSSQGFTLQEIFDSIAAAELTSRSNTEWLGGIDIDHVYIESFNISECGLQLLLGILSTMSGSFGSLRQRILSFELGKYRCYYFEDVIDIPWILDLSYLLILLSTPLPENVAVGPSNYQEFLPAAGPSSLEGLHEEHSLVAENDVPVGIEQDNLPFALPELPHGHGVAQRVWLNYNHRFCSRRRRRIRPLRPFRCSA